MLTQCRKEIPALLQAGLHFNPLATVATRNKVNMPQGSFIHPNPLVQPRFTGKKHKSKHAIPKFRAERAAKVFKPRLPDFHKKSVDLMTPEEIRAETKKLGIQPERRWNERPLLIASTASIFEAYVPPEGDGKASIISKEGAKQTVQFFGKKSKSMMAVRKIRQFDDDFEPKDFAEEALNIYINLHEALAKFDEKELHKLATENAYPLVVNEAKGKTIRWSFHGSLEPSRVVQVRQTHLLTDDNMFAQVTVRFHTQQILAVYDRFGRLIHGSESVLKDVLEYIVFEKHISNVYGVWRVHDKIIPPWMKVKATSRLTYKAPPPEDKTPTATTTTTTQEIKAEDSQTPVIAA